MRLPWGGDSGVSGVSGVGGVGDPIQICGWEREQIPCGNERKKSKNRSKGKGRRHRCFPPIRAIRLREWMGHGTVTERARIAEVQICMECRWPEVGATAGVWKPPRQPVRRPAVQGAGRVATNWINAGRFVLFSPRANFPRGEKRDKGPAFCAGARDALAHGCVVSCAAG